MCMDVCVDMYLDMWIEATYMCIYMCTVMDRYRNSCVHGHKIQEFAVFMAIRFGNRMPLFIG